MIGNVQPVRGPCDAIVRWYVTKNFIMILDQRPLITVVFEITYTAMVGNVDAENKRCADL